MNQQFSCHILFNFCNALIAPGCGANLPWSDGCPIPGTFVWKLGLHYYLAFQWVEFKRDLQGFYLEKCVVPSPFPKTVSTIGLIWRYTLIALDCGLGRIIFEFFLD